MAPKRRGGFFKILSHELILRPVTRPGGNLDEAQSLELTAYRALVQGDAELLPDPLNEVLQAPAHNAVDRRDRPAFDDLAKRPALGIAQFRRSAGRLAVDQTLRTLGVEAQDPIPDDLKPDTAKRRRLAATTALVNYRQRKQAPRLIGILRGLRQSPKRRAVKIISKWDRSGHGKPHRRLPP
jgi:hypothetical protein